MSEEHKTCKKNSGEKLLKALLERGIHHQLLGLLCAEDIDELTLHATYADGSTAVVQYDLRPTDH